ncbi:MAG: hypothetical protein AB7P03_18565 [Kofleriaceae bacterium]
MPDPVQTCVICQLAPLITALQRDRKACDQCAVKTGLIAFGPPRRRVASCSKCNHPQLVRFFPRELGTTHGQWTDPSVPCYGPMFATYRVPDDRGPVHPRSGFGILEAYACRSCGFVEWYCQDPEKIPIGPEYMTELIDVSGGSPFR